MTLLNIVEFRNIQAYPTNDTAQFILANPITTQELTPSGTSTTSATFNANTQIVRLCADTTVGIAFSVVSALVAGIATGSLATRDRHQHAPCCEHPRVFRGDAGAGVGGHSAQLVDYAARDLLFGGLAIRSVSEIDEPRRGLRHQRYPPPDQMLARFGPFGFGHTHTLGPAWPSRRYLRAASIEVPRSVRLNRARKSKGIGHPHQVSECLGI